MENRQKFEDVELQVLLDEDDSQTQTQTQLAEQLDVSQKAFLQSATRGDKDSEDWQMGLLNADELNDKEMKKRKTAKTHVTFCSLGTKESRFCNV